MIEGYSHKKDMEILNEYSPKKKKKELQNVWDKC